MIRARATYRDESLAHQFCITVGQLTTRDTNLKGDLLDTVKGGKEDHLGITILAHGLDVFSQLTQDLLSILPQVSQPPHTATIG